VTSDWIADDDRLFEMLRASLRSAGAVPPEVVSAAKDVFGIRNVDEELARLVYDSQADAQLAGAFRAETMSVRSLVFARGEVTLDIDVLPDAIVGQLSPARPGTIKVETREGETAQAAIDDTGMFSVPAVRRGELRLRVEPDQGEAFVTTWLRL
jgi:hypothetical protein